MRILCKICFQDISTAPKNFVFHKNGKPVCCRLHFQQKIMSTELALYYRKLEVEYDDKFV